MRADPEARLLAAMQRNKPVIAGHRKGDALEAKGADLNPPSTCRVRRVSHVVRGTKTKADSEPISANELAEMIALFDEIGDTKGVCERIAAQLTRPRTPQTVGNALNRIGARPFQTQIKRRGERR